MARTDWTYTNISIEMAEALNRIVKKEGKKHGIRDKNQLIRMIIDQFIAKYEETNDLIKSRDVVRLDKKRDAMKPIS